MGVSCRECGEGKIRVRSRRRTEGDGSKVTGVEYGVEWSGPPYERTEVLVGGERRRERREGGMEEGRGGERREGKGGDSREGGGGEIG